MAMTAASLAETLETARRKVPELSQTRVAELLRERGIKVGNKTVENWFRGYYRHPSGEQRPIEPSFTNVIAVAQVINDEAVRQGLDPVLAEPSPPINNRYQDWTAITLIDAAA